MRRRLNPQTNDSSRKPHPQFRMSAEQARLLRPELTALRCKLEEGKITLVPKVQIPAKLGYSPDLADAYIISHSMRDGESEATGKSEPSTSEDLDGSFAKELGEEGKTSPTKHGEEALPN
jgi:hypothetical protein